MTTELEALRRVAEAARKWLVAVSGLPLQTTEERDTMDACEGALLALDALPATTAESEGEVVEVAVWRDNDDGEVVFCIPKTERDGPLQGWTRLGTTRLALVPEVVGEVG